MPSMPAIDPSSTRVTWLSSTCALAPRQTVSTSTTGRSMFGYSRTVSRLNETTPIRMTTRLRTVAKTGRRMQSSDRPIGSGLLGRCRLDGGPVAQLHDAVGDDHRVALQAFDDLDLAAAALADLHLGQDGLALDDPEDELLA